MLQEEVQKMKAEQAAMARRQKTLMKNKLKDNIKQNPGKIKSYFQRKQIAVATAQPTEDPEKEVSSKRTYSKKVQSTNGTSVSANTVLPNTACSPGEDE